MLAHIPDLTYSSIADYIVSSAPWRPRAESAGGVRASPWRRGAYAATSKRSHSCRDPGPVEAHRTRPRLLARCPPDRTEPHPQRLARPCEGRPRRNGHLVPAAHADQQLPPGRLRLCAPATRANKPIGPLQPSEVLLPSLLGSQPGFKFRKRPWILFFPPLPRLGVTGAKQLLYTRNQSACQDICRSSRR